MANAAGGGVVMVSVLCVERRSVYKSLDVECFDIELLSNLDKNNITQNVYTSQFIDLYLFKMIFFWNYEIIFNSYLS